MSVILISVLNSGNFHPAQKLLISLRESVMRRTSLTMFKVAMLMNIHGSRII